MTVPTKILVLWYMTPFRLVCRNRRFWWPYCLRL